MSPVDILSAQSGTARYACASVEPEGKSRFAFLDGLRCLAILTVVLFHYFSRWTPPNNPENLYPYGHILLNFFQFGDFGVKLSFVISGFVIALTLLKCNSIGEFFSRRFARLFPAMFLCSIITFVITSVIPDGHPFRVHIISFLPSWTFMEPLMYNNLFSTNIFDSVDGAYWSLYIEAEFYLLIATIYFLSREHFLRNLVAYSVVTFLLETISGAFFLRTGSRLAHYVHWTMHFLQASDCLPWFLLGIGFFLYAKGKSPAQWGAPLALGITQLLIASGGKMIPALVALAITGIFYTAMTLPILGRILSYNPLVQTGRASYPLYLLHQNAGVTLIRFFSREFGLGVAASATFAFVLALMMIAFSRAIFQLYERQANAFLLKILVKRDAVRQESFIPTHPNSFAMQAIVPITPQEDDSTLLIAAKP